MPRYSIGPRDFSFIENTPLSYEDTANFIKWASENGRVRDMYDYDLAGAWKAQTQPSVNGHMSDVYKKSNHPTSKQNGTWIRYGNQDVFLAKDSPTAMSPQGLQEYFRYAEQPYMNNGNIQYGGGLVDTRLYDKTSVPVNQQGLGILHNIDMFNNWLKGKQRNNDVPLPLVGGIRG